MTATLTAPADWGRPQVDAGGHTHPDPRGEEPGGYAEYQCVTRVKAAKVVKVDRIRHRLQVQGEAEMTNLSAGWFNLYRPEVGGYLLLATDRYHVTFVPARKFERDYVRVDDRSPAAVLGRVLAGGGAFIAGGLIFTALLAWAVS